MLVIRELTKKYTKNKGVFDITYQFQEGTIYAIIGPNGSGKTTLLNIIAGISEYDSGIVALDNKKTMDRDSKINIGYGLDFVNYFSKTRVREFLKMICDIKYQGKHTEEIEGFLKDFQLDGDTMIDRCSLGMQKKLTIAASLIGFPKLIILDEPTNGVDTMGILQLKNYMKEARRRNCIVLLSSHILDFIDSVTERVIFLKNGRFVDAGEGTLEEQYMKLYLSNDSECP